MRKWTHKGTTYCTNLWIWVLEVHWVCKTCPSVSTSCSRWQTFCQQLCFQGNPLIFSCCDARRRDTYESTAKQAASLGPSSSFSEGDLYSTQIHDYPSQGNAFYPVPWFVPLLVEQMHYWHQKKKNQDPPISLGNWSIPYLVMKPKLLDMWWLSISQIMEKFEVFAQKLHFVLLKESPSRSVNLSFWVLPSTNALARSTTFPLPPPIWSLW